MDFNNLGMYMEFTQGIVHPPYLYLWLWNISAEAETSGWPNLKQIISQIQSWSMSEVLNCCFLTLSNPQNWTL